jgi:hypothetical protein
VAGSGVTCDVPAGKQYWVIPVEARDVKTMGYFKTISQ